MKIPNDSALLSDNTLRFSLIELIEKIVSLQI